MIVTETEPKTDTRTSRRTHLKIAFCGVPGSGKTALAREVANRLSLPLIYQGTKELRATVGDVGKMPPFWRMNEVQRIMYQLNLIQYRRETEQKYAEFVADGCAVDMQVWYRMAAWLVPLDQKNMTTAGLAGMVANYDFIFYLPYYQAPDYTTSDEKEAVDPFNLLTADFIMKGTVSYMVHSGQNVYVIQTPPFLPTASPDEDNVKVALEKRVDEVMHIVLGPTDPNVRLM